MKSLSMLLLAAGSASSSAAVAQQISEKVASEAMRPTIEGTLDLLDVDKTSGVSLGASARAFWRQARWLQSGVGIGYWANERTSDERYGDFMVGLHARSLSSLFEPVALRSFIDLGVDVHRLTIERGGVRNDETRLGWSGGLGLVYALQPRLELIGGVQFRRIIGDAPVRFDQLAFSGGVQYRI